MACLTPLLQHRDDIGVEGYGLLLRRASDGKSDQSRT
jgi:hypothetical protein